MDKLKNKKIFFVLLIIFFIYSLVWNFYASIYYKKYAKEADGYVYQQNNQYIKYVGDKNSDNRYMFFVQSPKYLHFYGGRLYIKQELKRNNELYAEMEIYQNGEKTKMVVVICKNHFDNENGIQRETTERVARFELDANMEFYIGVKTIEESRNFEQYRYLIEKIYEAEHKEWGFCNVD